MTLTTPSTLPGTKLLVEGDIITPGTIFQRPDGTWNPVDCSSWDYHWNPDDFHPMAYPATTEEAQSCGPT